MDFFAFFQVKKLFNKLNNFNIFSVPQMEKQFGPIWPFNIACVSFSGAALGIWFDVIVRGCYDYLLDKEYFAHGPQVENELKS